MRNIFGSLFAIGVAGVAAVAATTAMLNSPLRIGPATDQPAAASAPPANSDGQTAPPAGSGGPAATPDAATGGTPAAIPGAAPSGAAAQGDKPEEADQDPYEGIAPEELPPDLQYDADSSVSFPTNI